MESKMAQAQVLLSPALYREFTACECSTSLFYEIGKAGKDSGR
jgi:hypothetical protein